jgi:hypothetical protein
MSMSVVGSPAEALGTTRPATHSGSADSKVLKLTDVAKATPISCCTGLYRISDPSGGTLRSGVTTF